MFPNVEAWQILDKWLISYIYVYISLFHVFTDYLNYINLLRFLIRTIFSKFISYVQAHM